MPVDGAAVLSPAEMREMREIVGVTFTQLSKATGISRAQFCEYSTGVGNLRGDQIEICERVLRKAMVAHGARIAKLVAGEKAA
jgi:hypothetical protein